MRRGMSRACARWRSPSTGNRSITLISLRLALLELGDWGDLCLGELRDVGCLVSGRCMGVGASLGDPSHGQSVGDHARVAGGQPDLPRTIDRPWTLRRMSWYEGRHPMGEATRKALVRPTGAIALDTFGGRIHVEWEPAALSHRSDRCPSSSSSSR
jgi:hypothetical protein